MKKIILSIVAVLGLGFANAQDTATEGGFANGDAFISGGFSFGSTKNGDFKESSFQIAPSVGFFVTPNIALGGRVGYASESENDLVGASLVETTVSTFGVGVFGRYYTTPASKFSIFGELGFVYETAKVGDDSPGSEDSKANGFGIELAPGVSYFLSKNFALEAKWGVLGYSSAKADVEGAEATNNFSIGLNLSDISFGLVYKF
ncbi:MAG TPA: outer membrane beta-barrel protein [Flavobacterium sp.]|jgi:outer membrane protein